MQKTYVTLTVFLILSWSKPYPNFILIQFFIIIQISGQILI